MNKFNLCLVTAALAVTSINATAMAYPKSKGFSKNIQTVEYNEDNVVRLGIKTGVVTLIKLESGETISGKEAAVGIGNITAWDLAVRGNNVFIKPKLNNPTTNLILTTNKGRTYTFLLVPRKTATYKLDFTYPETKMQVVKRVKKIRLEHEAKVQANRTPCMTSNRINYHYFKQGNNNLAPNAVWDDGKFTCFAFPANKELPLIYSVNDDKSESLLNTSIKNNITVVHSIHSQYRLRAGTDVLGIETSNIKPQQFSTKATTLPQYKRVINE